MNQMCQEKTEQHSGKALPDTRPILKTQRLILRPFQLDDEAEVYRICKEKEIAAFTRTIPHPYPRAQAKHWIEQQPELWRKGKSACFAMSLKKNTRRIVGSIGLTICEGDQNAELGYLVEKESWGQGYCSEAAAEVVRFGFEQLALHRIHAHHVIENPASGRILAKIGMREEGLLRGHVRKWGVFHDVRVWGILASEFAKTLK